MSKELDFLMGIAFNATFAQKRALCTWKEKALQYDRLKCVYKKCRKTCSIFYSGCL